MNAGWLLSGATLLEALVPSLEQIWNLHFLSIIVFHLAFFLLTFVVSALPLYHREEEAAVETPSERA